MTKTINIDTVPNSIRSVIALTENGDEVVLEENGKPIAKVVPIAESGKEPAKKRVMGLGTGKGYFMSDDFDDELPDEFWGFDKDEL